MKAQLPKHQRHSLGTPGCRERGESGEGWGRGTTPPKSDFFFFFFCFIMIPTTSLSNLSEFYGTGYGADSSVFISVKKPFRQQKSSILLPFQPQSVLQVKVTVDRFHDTLCLFVRIWKLKGRFPQTNLLKNSRPCSRWPSRIVFPPQHRRWHTFCVPVHSSRQSMWPCLVTDSTSGQTLHQNIKPSDFQQLAHRLMSATDIFHVGTLLFLRQAGRKVKRLL